jgi:hypothetical protein
MQKQAGYMAAPERFAESQIPLAPRAPSIHGPPAARCKPKVMIWKVGLAHLYPAY